MREFDLADIIHATYTAKEHIANAAKMVNDIYREERLQTQECQSCYYNPKIGGCAMTKRNCSACNTEMLFGSTNTDKLCLQCAKGRGVCKHCGADLDLKTRRQVLKSN